MLPPPCKERNKIMRYIILLLILFTISVITLSVFGNYTIKESIHKCMEFLKMIFKELFSTEEKPEPIYPVYIGSDGNKIVPNLVEEEFADIYKFFEVCYFDKFGENQNRIGYKFNIKLKVDNLDKQDFELLIQKATEKILLKHFREYNFYMPCECLIVVELMANSLYIGIAKNESGILEIEKKKEQQRHKHYLNQVSTEYEEIQEEWKDED